MSDIGTYEQLLANWRNKEAQAEALRQFRDTGGKHRIRITTDNENTVIEKLLCSMMDGQGFVAILNSAVGRAENEAKEARGRFMQSTTPGLVSVDRNGKVTLS